MNRMTACLTLLLLFAPPLAAEQRVDETREARADARVEVTAVTGRYRVTGSDRNTLEITGTLGADVEALIIDGDPGHWIVEVKAKRGRSSPRGSASDLTIHLPQGAELEISTVSGDIELQDLNGAWVQAKSVSGDIALSAVQPQRLAAETVSGRLAADGGGRDESRFRSVSGNFRAENLSGRIRLATVSGHINASATAVEDAELETVSGRIEVSLVPLQQARIQLSSHSGELHLRLPEDTPLDLRANTFSGRIRTDFGGEVEERRGRGPGQGMEVRRGAGTVRIEAKSFSGSINVEAE